MGYAICLFKIFKEYLGIFQTRQLENTKANGLSHLFHVIEFPGDTLTNKAMEVILKSRDTTSVVDVLLELPLLGKH